MSGRSDTGRSSGGAETSGHGGDGYDAIAGAYAERKLHQGVQLYVHQMLDALTVASRASTAPLRAGSEVARVLRPGACAAVSLLTGTGTACEEVAYAPGHWRTFTHWTPDALMDVAAGAGLKVVRVEQTLQAGGTTWIILRHPVRGPEAIARRRR